MKKIAKLTAVFLATVLLISGVGCGKKYQDAIIYFETPDKPATADPQTASTVAELILASNTFEGLLRRNSSGAVVCGVSESYSRSGNEYTFVLKNNVKWSNGEPLTAHDFVFGFRRAVMPETRSPFAKRLFCIENAEKINRGELQPDALGVTADGDYKLKIKLCYDDESFEETLTTSVAMPCNEKFFEETGGRYGLAADSIISCGSYKITKWTGDPFALRLKKNPEYSGTFPAKNAAVYITKDKEKTAFERLRDNNVDISFIDSSLMNEAKADKLLTVEYKNICWYLTMSDELSAGLRRSFLMLTGSNVYAKDFAPGFYTAGSVFPPAVCQTVISAGLTEYNAAAGKALYTAETSKLENGKLPSEIKLYYSNTDSAKPIITDIVGHWQNNLGAYINIIAADKPEALAEELKSKTLPMAVFPVTADSESLSEYADKFGINYGGETEEQLQEKILRSSNVLPIAYQSTVIAYSEALSDVFTELGNGYIDFSFIVKTD